MHRLPRCSPNIELQYKEWTIPTGVSLVKPAKDFIPRKADRFENK